ARVDPPDGARRVADHRDAVEAEPIDLAGARGHPPRLPAPAARDLDAAMPVMTPRARRHDEAVPRVAEARLEALADHVGERVGRDVRSAVDDHARLPLARAGAAERRVEPGHRRAARIVEPHLLAEDLLLETLGRGRALGLE